MKVFAKLPIIYKVKDYHEFDFIKNVLDATLSSKTDHTEIGCDHGGKYWGVIYPLGHTPDFVTVIQLVQNHEARNNNDRKANLDMAIGQKFNYKDYIFTPESVEAFIAMEEKAQLNKLYNQNKKKLGQKIL